MLGVSKQNISNIENGKTNLSQAQYIAIRHLIEYKAAQKPQNKMLLRIVSLIVDRSDIVGHDYNTLKDTVKNIGAAAASMNGEALNTFAAVMLKASYTRAADHSEIEGLLKDAIESKQIMDWTTVLVNANVKEEK